MSLYRFNDRGIKAYTDFFNQKLNDDSLPVPYELLEDRTYVEAMKGAQNIEVLDFGNRYDLGVYLNKVLSGLDYWDIYQDYGLWNWLSLKYFNKIYPSPRKAKEQIRYVLSENDRSFWYRHLIRCPWDLVYRHQDAAKVLLTKPLNVHADETEQLLAQQYIRSNKNMFEVLNNLYYIPSKKGDVGTFRKGYTSQEKAAGSVRRLAVVIKQLACTWDLHSMNYKEILGLLPDDFQELIEDKEIA